MESITAEEQPVEIDKDESFENREKSDIPDILNQDTSDRISTTIVEKKKSEEESITRFREEDINLLTAPSMVEKSNLRKGITTDTPENVPGCQI